MSDELLTEPNGVDESTDQEEVNLSDYEGENIGDDTGEESDSESVEEELDEIEFDGKKYKINKALQDAIMLRQDYTRKTQEVAEQRKQAEAMHQILVEREKFQNENLKDYATVVSIDEQLDDMAKIDFSKWMEQDPIKANQAYIAMQQLRERKAQVINSIQQRDFQFKQTAQEQKAKALAEGNAKLSKEIPGWGPEVAAKLRNYAVNDLGFTNEDVAQVYDHRVVKLLYRAMQAEELSKRVKSKAQTNKQETEARPAATVKGGSAPKSGEPRSTQDWMSWRNSQLRSKKGK